METGFVIENGVLKNYTGAGRDVVIPKGVTEIGVEAFSWCKNLQSVVIPEGITEIRYRTFCRCKARKKTHEHQQNQRITESPVLK